MPLFTLAMRFPKTEDRRGELRGLHRSYLAGLRDEGKVVAAGPWGHESGALIIFQADDAAEARTLLANDPYVREGVLDEVELHEWQPVIGGAPALA